MSIVNSLGQRVDEVRTLLDGQGMSLVGALGEGGGGPQSPASGHDHEKEAIRALDRGNDRADGELPAVRREGLRAAFDEGSAGAVNTLVTTNDRLKAEVLGGHRSPRRAPTSFFARSAPMPVAT